MRQPERSGSDPRRAEEISQKVDRLRQILFNMARDMIFIHRVSRDGRAESFIEVNDAACEVLGYSREEMLKIGPMDIISGRDMEDVPKEAEILDSRCQLVVEKTFISKSGHRIPVEIHLRLFKCDNQTFAVSIARNIDERKRTEEALRESERKLRALVESTIDWVWEVDPEGRYTYAGPNVEGIIGYTPEELRGKTPFELMDAREARRVGEIFSKIAAKREHIIALEDTLLHKDGHPVVFETNATPLFDAAGTFQGYFGTCRAITERKLAEEALIESEARFRCFVDHFPAYVYIKDDELKHVFANRSLLEFARMNAAEWAGTTSYDLYSSEIAQELERGDRLVLDESRIVEKEFSFIGRTGDVGWIRDLKFPLEMPNGDRFIGGISIDITEQKELEAQLIQTQKMEAVSTLAGGIAHDFNNILGIIMGNVSCALSSIEKDDELHDVLLDVQQGAKQAHELTQQLLTFARGGEPIKKETNLNRLIRESAGFVTRGATSRCEFELSNELWTAEIDEGQINQVIGNLVINANQAMPSGGIIKIQTDNARIERNSGLPLPEGRYIKIIVSDQGIGISEKCISRIFDPYFTTKQEGSGLGLSTVYSIVKKHGGYITVYSELDKGTTFQIYLPAASTDPDGAKSAESMSHRGSGRILIMDDQEPILKMISRMLSAMGYETALAADGAEAIELYREAYRSPNPFNLVILDLTVPGGMGGIKAMLEITQINPRAKVVVSSGYSNDPIMSNYRDYGFCGVVPKPYTKDQIAALLNNIFGETEK